MRFGPRKGECVSLTGLQDTRRDLREGAMASLRSLWKALVPEKPEPYPGVARELWRVSSCVLLHTEVGLQEKVIWQPRCVR